LCDGLCRETGLKAFVAALKVANPDPFIFCQLNTLCSVSNVNAAANNTQLVVSPLTASVGTTFTFNVTQDVIKTVVFGELVIEFTPPHGGTPFDWHELVVDMTPGTYITSTTLNTSLTRSMSYPTGKYLVKAMLCAGACDGKHSSERVLTQSTSSFQLT
jgi:hypothetical protein